MDRAGTLSSRDSLCFGCAQTLGVNRAADDMDAIAPFCRRCGGPVAHQAATGCTREIGLESPVGHLGLVWRGWVLRLIEVLYWAGTFGGTIVVLAFGGFVPVLRGWLSNHVSSWSDVVATLGGVWLSVDSLDPDSDLGPVLARVDAPLLFETIESVGRRLGVKPPSQVRLTYLPCCGVVAWRRSRALIIGLPLFRVLTQRELRAVVAHELAHLARGDATRAARSARFVESLEHAVARAPRARGPLGFWARFLIAEALRLIEPVARGQEARADRSSAIIAGGATAAQALVKVALIQPLFKEVLDAYDPRSGAGQNLYAFFRGFWYRLPPELHSSMRLALLASRDRAVDPAHPPLPMRIALLQSYPDPASSNGDAQSSSTFLGDLEIFEQMLHNRLFSTADVAEPSVFHRNGS